MCILVVFVRGASDRVNGGSEGNPPPKGMYQKERRVASPKASGVEKIPEREK